MSTQMGRIRRFFHPIFTNCVHAKNDVGQNVHISEREILFLANYLFLAIANLP